MSAMLSLREFIKTSKLSTPMSSTQFGLPDEFAEKVMEWTKDNIPDEWLHNSDSRETDIHITTLYGLHTNNPTVVKEHLSDQKPFEIKIGKISRFTSNKEYDVIKVDVQGTGIHKLNQKLKKLDYTNSYDTYSPHMTLAYIDKKCGKDLDGNLEFYGEKFTVDHILFSNKSQKKTKISFE